MGGLHRHRVPSTTIPGCVQPVLAALDQVEPAAGVGCSRDSMVARMGKRGRTLDAREIPVTSCRTDQRTSGTCPRGCSFRLIALSPLVRGLHVAISSTVHRLQAWSGVSLSLTCGPLGLGRVPRAGTIDKALNRAFKGLMVLLYTLNPEP